MKQNNTKCDPKMDEIRTELDKLEDKRLDYVMARSLVTSDSAGYINAGISKTAFYKWSVDERDRLNELAQAVKRQTVIRAIKTLQDAADEAALVKVAGLKERDPRVRQSAASEILDRTVGKAADKIDVQSGGEAGLKIIVEYENSQTTTPELPSEPTVDM